MILTLLFQIVRSKKLYLPLLTIFCLTSCSSLYMPNVPDTPMFTSRGELHGSGHISLKGNASFNAAYAFSDNFALMLNGSYINRNREKKDFQHNLIEAGAGYFTTFGKENNRILEIYGGYGTGSSERVYSNLNYDGPTPYDWQETSFDKYFAQVNYSSKTKKSLKLFGNRYPLNYGTALRMSYVNMKEFVLRDVAQPGEDNIFLEPVFFTRLRINDNFQLQYTSGSNFGLKNRKYLTAGNSVFTIGAVYNVGGKKLK